MNLYNPVEFWRNTWAKEGCNHPPESFYRNIAKILKKYGCYNVLEVGCGEAYGRKILKGFKGLDFCSPPCAVDFPYDLTDDLPLEDEMFDCVLSRMTLLHVPPNQIDKAVSNIKRLTNNLIVLCEYPHLGSDDLNFHCFNHNLRSKFKGSNVVFVDAYGRKGELKY
jgi:SAM-dependent methyltransferase